MSRRRLRAHPVQIYLSEHELQLLDEIAERRRCTRADLVRGWIHRAKSQQARSGSTPPPPIDDPRQLRVPGS